MYGRNTIKVNNRKAMAFEPSFRVIALLLGIFILCVLAFHEREGSLAHQLRSISGEWKGSEITLILHCSQQKRTSLGECKVSSYETPQVEEIWTLYRVREGSFVFLLSSYQSVILSKFSTSLHPTMYSDMKTITVIGELKNTTFHRSSRSNYQHIIVNGRYFFYLTCILFFSLLGQWWIRKKSSPIHKEGKVVKKSLKKYE